MKSEAAVRRLVAAAKQLFLPDAGADFTIEYYRGDDRVEPSPEGGHDHIVATSVGQRVVVMGEDTRVTNKRQQKPLCQIPTAINGVQERGFYRSMLVIRHGDTWIHFLGDLVVVDSRKLRVGEVAPGLLPEDEAMLEALRAGPSPIQILPGEEEGE